MRSPRGGFRVCLPVLLLLLFTGQVRPAALRSQQQPRLTTLDLFTCSNESNMTTWNLDSAGLARIGMSFMETESTSGKVHVINRGVKLPATCQCQDDFLVPENKKIPMTLPYGVCAATDIKVVEINAGSGMSEDDVRLVLGNPMNADWASVRYHHFSEWEPRTEVKMLGNPGGDIIEMINMLDVYEDTFGARFRWWDCRWIMYVYMHRTPKISFYMATDTKAMNLLGSFINQDGIDIRLKPHWSSYWTVLRALLAPEHNGSPTLKAMLSDPTGFQVRKGLPQCVIGAYFHVLWNKYSHLGRKLRLVKLMEPTKAKAVIKLKTSTSCQMMGYAPLLCPLIDDFKMFVAHPGAADYYRDDLTRFIARLDWRIDVKKFSDKMKSNGALYLDHAIGDEGSGLPVYEVTLM